MELPDIYIPPCLRTVSSPVQQIRGLAEQPYEWDKIMIGIPVAHERYTGRGIKIGILDSGVRRPGHSNYNYSSVYAAQSFIDNTVEDENGHGTNVHSILSLKRKPIGGCPDAEFAIAKVLDRNNSGTKKALIDGTEWLYKQDVKIINGSVSFGSSKIAEDYKRVMEEGIKDGRIFVFSAGNRGVWGEVDFPSSADQVFCTTAVDSNQNIASYSNKSMDADFAAPGTNILGCHHLTDSYVAFTGTSQAAPNVTSLLALYAQQWVEQFGTFPSYQQLYELCTQHVLDLGTKGLDPSYGHGLLTWGEVEKCDLQTAKHVVRESLSGVKRSLYDFLIS